MIPNKILIKLIITIVKSFSVSRTQVFLELIKL